MKPKKDMENNPTEIRQKNGGVKREIGEKVLHAVR